MKEPTGLSELVGALAAFGFAIAILAVRWALTVPI
jgi:hypothetical protein